MKTWRSSIGYFLLFICLGLDMAVIGPALPSLASQTGEAIGTLGLIFFLSAGGSASGTLLGSWLFGWAPGRAVLFIAQILSAALMLLVPEIPGVWLLLGLFIVKGVAGGLINTGANTLMTWTYRERSSPYINALHFFFGFGAFCSPFLFGWIVDSGGSYHDCFRLLGMLGLIVGVLAMILLRDPERIARKETEAAGGGRLSGRETAVLISAALFLFFYVGAEIAYGGWVYTFAVSLSLADAASAAYLTSLFWFSFTIGRLIFTVVSARIAPPGSPPAALSGCFAFLSLGLFLPGRPELIWWISAGTGFCMAPLWANGFALVSRSILMTARRSAMVILGDSVGGMLLPGLLGFIIEGAGPESVLPVVAFSLAGAVMTYGGMAFLVRGPRKEPTIAGS